MYKLTITELQKCQKIIESGKAPMEHFKLTKQLFDGTLDLEGKEYQELLCYEKYIQSKIRKEEGKKKNYKTNYKFKKRYEY